MAESTPHDPRSTVTLHMRIEPARSTAAANRAAETWPKRVSVTTVQMPPLLHTSLIGAP
jgi:hypothetical protein